MMNSTTDDFGGNPFRSSNSDEDLFFDTATTAPNTMASGQPQQLQQPPPLMQQQPPPLMQHSQGDPFAPQPTGAMPPPVSNFAPPTGPMQAMPAPQSHQHQQPAGMQPPAQPTSWWGNLMMCVSLDSYKAYFDIDADDILARIRAVPLHFYKPEYFRNNVLGVQKTDSLKGPDLYGPFWITMTLIFFIGVTSNMHDYLHKNDVEEFDYDINHLLHAASVMCSYSFVLPALLWITTQCMSMNALQLVEWVCIYGYSLVPFVPAVILSIIPFGLVSWICLMLATIASCTLVIRNVAAPLLSSDAGQAKASPIIMAILGTHIIFFLFLKFSFYHHTGFPGTSKSSGSSGGDSSGGDSGGDEDGDGRF